MPYRIVTANRLLHGEVVFLAADGAWTTRVEEAAVAEDKAEEEALLAIAKRAFLDRLVVDVNAIDVTLEQGRPRPVRLRERIRAFGPTVRSDLGIQALTA